MTEGERKLWRILRCKRLAGFRFRRQATIGPFIADFFCPKARLVVEVDGAPHTDQERIRKDEARTRWLEARGLRVIRFWNVDVFQRPEDVADVICRAATAPLPTRCAGHLPPQGGKEE